MCCTVILFFNDEQASFLSLLLDVLEGGVVTFQVLQFGRCELVYEAWLLSFTFTSAGFFPLY